MKYSFRLGVMVRESSCGYSMLKSSFTLSFAPLHPRSSVRSAHSPRRGARLSSFTVLQALYCKNRCSSAAAPSSPLMSRSFLQSVTARPRSAGVRAVSHSAATAGQRRTYTHSSAGKFSRKERLCSSGQLLMSIVRSASGSGTASSAARRPAAGPFSSTSAQPSSVVPSSARL